jgi:hypothetical protein
MCLFFKRKPKFNKDEVDAVLMRAMTELDIPGLPSPSERNSENFVAKFSSTDLSRGVNVKGTVNGFVFSISVYFTLKGNYTQTYVSFPNISFHKRYEEQRFLTNKYPLFKFSFSPNSTSIDMLRSENGEKIFDTRVCKSIDELAATVKDIGETLAYSLLYKNVIEQNKGQRIGE